jgi:RNA polymerase sigma-70 factor (ECF subfamily)
MDRLPADQREALVMVVIHGMSYEALAEATGCAVGTAKSRVFRARRQLEGWLLGDTKETNRTAVRLAREKLAVIVDESRVS